MRNADSEEVEDDFLFHCPTVRILVSYSRFLYRNGFSPADFLLRHMAGDFGVCGEAMSNSNYQALASMTGTVTSVYEISGSRLQILTDLETGETDIDLSHMS